MKRGEIRTLQADGYASKPRPVVIVQSDAVDRFDSVITCLLTHTIPPTSTRGSDWNQVRRTA